MAISLGPPLPTGSSDQPGDWLGVHVSPYAVLLQMGFALPPSSPTERCALTAPFHPYSPEASGMFLWHFP